MEHEPIIVGDGLIGQLECKDPPKEIRFSDIVECARQIFEEEAKKPQIIMYTGGTIYYGHGCKTLAQVRYARKCAIYQKKIWTQYFGIFFYLKTNNYERTLYNIRTK